MNEEPSLRQADAEILRKLVEINTDLGPLPPPKAPPKPWAEKPSLTTAIVVALVLSAVAALLIAFTPIGKLL